MKELEKIDLEFNISEEMNFLLMDMTKKYYSQKDINDVTLKVEESDYLNIIEYGFDSPRALLGGVVYFIHMKETPFYKIGITSDYGTLENRIRTFKTGIPFDLEVVCYTALEKGISEPKEYIEKFLHNYFKKYRKNREWFELNDNQVKAISWFLCHELDVIYFDQNEEYLI